jgi:hypothetical protein
MTMINELKITMNDIKADAEKSGYPYDIGEWDGGECITVYQSVYCQTHYYFNKNGICEDVEVEEVDIKF